MQKNSFILRNLESITSKIASLVKLMHLKIADNPFTFAFALMRKGAKIGSSFHASYSNQSWIVCIGFSTPQGMHPPPAGEGGGGVKISEKSLLGKVRNFDLGGGGHVILK